jgi:N-acetylmuramoyl-L-alanine amidase
MQTRNSDHPGAASAFPDSVPNPNIAADSPVYPASNARGSASSPAGRQELSKVPQITGIRHWSSGDSSTVVFELEYPVEYEAHRLQHPERIYFDLRNTKLAADLAGKSIKVDDALLHRIRIAQPVVGMTRIVLETKIRSGFSVRLESNPYQLVVELRNIEENSNGVMNAFPEAAAVERKKLAIAFPPPIQKGSNLQSSSRRIRIVIDAGHGGWDLGTLGRGGLIEKNLVLEVAQRLGKLLEAGLSSEVILTRNADVYIPLEERTKIANQAEADLFISVHANYSSAPSARGVETYYTDVFFAADSNDSETGTSGIGTKRAETTPLSLVSLQKRTERSRRLASSVQRSLYSTLQGQNPGLRDRGIKQANFVVLERSAMPGILVEVSFVSSPADEQNLRNDGYREKIAAAVYQGIAHYLAATSSGEKIAATREP